MSSSLLRTSRSLCSSCLRWRHHRLYVSHAALATSAFPTGSLQQTETPSSGPSHAPGKANSQKGFRSPRETKSGDHTPLQSRNPLELTSVDLYLASIHAAGLEPTLDDIERCRPKRHSSSESSKYAEEYNNLLDTLCRSFSKDQLRKFTELYQLDPIWTRTSRRKVEYAESIIEKQWDWPSLKEIERRKRDRTEVVVKSQFYSADCAHSEPDFCSIRRQPKSTFPHSWKRWSLPKILPSSCNDKIPDGADLLQLSMQYNVHISLASNPLALRVEGLRGAMKQLTEHLNDLKKVRSLNSMPMIEN